MFGAFINMCHQAGKVSVFLQNKINQIKLVIKYVCIIYIVKKLIPNNAQILQEYNHK